MSNDQSTIQPNAMHVNTWLGLRPISEFDEVEIHEMKPSEDGFDYDESDFGRLWQATDCDPSVPVVAYSVFLHLHAGGIECVQDFGFDPGIPGAAKQAKREAEILGKQLTGMLRASGMLRSIRSVSSPDMTNC